MRRPDPVLTALVVVAVSLSLGCASYRAGTARILYAIDAVELPHDASPWFHDRVDALAAGMAVEPPALLVGTLGSPNALALGGPGNGRVALDVTLFRLLEPDELSAVVAHEMAHIAARDSLTKTLGYSLVQTAGGLLALVVLPVALARSLPRIERAATPEGPLSSLYIHGDEEVRLTRLLAGHPPMAERIERLVESAGTAPRRGGPLDRF